MSLPFLGSFYDSITAEWVDVSGSVNVTARVTLGSTLWTLDFYSALPSNMTATGRTTGIRYIANGGVAQTIQVPPNPVRPVFAQSVFKIFSPADPDSHPNDPYRRTLDNFVVTFNLGFSSDGTLAPLVAHHKCGSGLGLLRERHVCSRSGIVV